jgi:arylsulfatase A-like enzyme
MRNLVYIVVDSARYDTFVEARTPNMDAVARTERRYSFASWTSPSHFVYLMGMTPHANPIGVFASEVYHADYRSWGPRLGMGEIAMKEFVPQFWLPGFLKLRGYATHAMVSMPIINPKTVLSRDFDSYRLMERHDDFGAIIDAVAFSPARPSFYFLNLGEAHYPYMIPQTELPPLIGDGGVIRRRGEVVPGVGAGEAYYDAAHLKRFREGQVAAIERVDRLMGRLLEKCPAETYCIITSDHGELFGEDGFFGHGPICHEKVFEVPFLEGAL